MKSKDKIIADIKKYGWHTIHVLEDEIGGKYSYTIGLSESFDHPEIVISGLNPDTCSMIFEGIVETIKENFRYEINKRYNDILEGYDCIFKSIDINKYDNLFGRSQVYYGEKDYKVLQLFYPDENGNFPWDDGYSLKIQEVL
jgi:hypothetical protein